MSSSETPDEGGTGILAGLLAPLRLPERALEALEGLVDAAGNLAPMRSEIVRVREQTEPLGKLLPALERIQEEAKPLAKVLPSLERVRKQTEPLSELLPALERLRKQTEPLGEVLPVLERLREQTEPLAELIPLLERLRKQTEPLAKLLPALDHLEERLGTRLDSLHEVVMALESDESHLSGAVRDLHRELDSMHETLRGLQDDVQSVTHRLPDPSRGPLEKARDVLTSGPAQPKEE